MESGSNSNRAGGTDIAPPHWAVKLNSNWFDMTRALPCTITLSSEGLSEPTQHMQGRSCDGSASTIPSSSHFMHNIDQRQCVDSKQEIAAAAL